MYFDRSTWSFNHSPPGIPVPAALVLLAAPALGLVFIMFMPAVGFWLTGKAILKGCARLAIRMRVQLGMPL